MTPAERSKPYAPDVHAVVRLEEALPPDHPVHVFVDLVRGIDLGHFRVPPGPKGEKPYQPHALFGVLAWGYLHGVRSSRKLARLARQEAAFVYLAGGGQPNSRTLARFRRENAAAFTAVLQESVILALRLGLAQLGHVALDGTKVKANTSKHKAMSYGRMRQREAQLKEEIARLVQQAERRTRLRIGSTAPIRTATRSRRNWRYASGAWRRSKRCGSGWRRSSGRSRAWRRISHR
jgi:transposase